MTCETKVAEYVKKVLEGEGILATLVAKDPARARFRLRRCEIGFHSRDKSRQTIAGRAVEEMQLRLIERNVDLGLNIEMHRGIRARHDFLLA